MKVLATLEENPEGLHFNQVVKSSGVSKSLCSPRLRTMQAEGLVTWNPKTKIYKISKGAADDLFVKDMGNWLTLNEPAAVRGEYGTVVTSAIEGRDEFADVMANPVFVRHLSRVVRMLMEAWLKHTIAYLNIDTKRLAEALEYEERLIEYEHLKAGMPVPRAFPSVKPYSFAGWHARPEEVEKMKFSGVELTRSKVRRIRRLRGYLRNTEARKGYEAYAKHMTEFRTALLVPITGFENYSELDQILKDVKERVRTSKEKPGHRF